MHVPVSWLKQLVPNSLSSAALAEKLTVAGIEIEGIEGVGVFSDKVVCAALIDTQATEHDGVYLVRLDIGHEIQITAKDPALAQLHEGSLLALALPGARLLALDDSAWQLRDVKAEKRYGHASAGVLCSAPELGLPGSATDLLRLQAGLTPGQPLHQQLTIAEDSPADEIMEVAILANIARCQSMWGMAREVAALTGAELSAPPELAEIDDDLPELTPVIAAPEIAKRFTLLKIDNISVQPSPMWMQRQLTLAGVRPINNVVDATNYVMLALGQPMHAYDANKLPTLALSVRTSQAGDTLHTLAQEADDQAQALLPGHPVIVADNQPVALAGVVGGTLTAIDEQSQSILLEAAHFDYIAVRRSQAAHKTFTESSARFSRGVDVQLTLSACRYFVNLLRETCPQLQLSGFGDTQNVTATKRLISLSCQQLTRTLGIELSIDAMVEQLAKLGIATSVEDDVLTAQVDSTRDDLTEPCDLIEEIVRLYGYDQLPETMPIQPIAQPLTQTVRVKREQVRDGLVLSGLQEVISYHMTNPEVEARLNIAAAHIDRPNYVRLLNPVSEERCVMRRSLLPSLLQHAQFNLRFNDACHIFEIGRVFLPEREGSSPLLPSEPYRLAALMVGPVQKSTWHTGKTRMVDFYDMSAVVSELFEHLHIDEIELEPAQQNHFHPGCCARILKAGKCYGYIGVVHDLVAQAFALEGHKLIGLEIELDEVLSDISVAYPIKASLRYPSIELDISVEVDESITAQWLRSLIKSSGGTILQHIDIFDVYRSEQLGKNKKAIALHLVFNGKTRTLTMEEACVVRDQIVTNLEQEVGAKLRDA